MLPFNHRCEQSSKFCDHNLCARSTETLLSLAHTAGPPPQSGSNATGSREAGRCAEHLWRLQYKYVETSELSSVLLAHPILIHTPKKQVC